VESLPLPMLLYDGALFAGAVFDPGLFSMQRTQTIWNQDLRNKLLGAEFERKALKEGLARIRNYLQEINLRYIRERSERVSRSLEKRVRALRQEEISLCEKLNVRNRFFQGVPDRLAVPVVLVEKGPPVPDRAAKIAARLATHAFGRDMVRKLELEHFAIREKGRLFWEVRCEVAVVHPANDRTTWHACTFRIDATEPGNEEFVHNSVEIDR